MSSVSQSHTNISERGILERGMISSLTTLSCCVFLYINGIMLFTLRSKTVFCETSRYVLLYNLLFADSVLMALSQLLYIIAAMRLRLTYPVCGFLTLLTELMTKISPLTLVVMSLERYVAVCYPLRHAAIITMRKIRGAVCGIWAFSSLNILTHIILLSETPLDTLQMEEFCDKKNLLLSPKSVAFDNMYTYVVFGLSGVSVIFSYIGVVAAARSASTDKASARKARNTLLLHLVQLGLSLSSTAHNPILIALSKVTERKTFHRFQIVLYMSIIICPRCLSALIYGIRDQTIRPVLMYHLCCQLTSRYLNQVSS